MKWEKIKSAPRDGTRVAIAYLSSLSNNAEWIVREGRWISNENLSGVWMVDGDKMLLDKSIHGTGAQLWQPMPVVDVDSLI